MPVYRMNPRTDACGYCVGILLLDLRQPFVPGDVGNATSYDYPVLYRTVPGASAARVFVGDPDLNDAVVETARELVDQGVKGISSDCGFFVNFQDLLAEAVDVPVFLSSLLQLPLVSSFLGRDRTLGVLTANTTALGNRVLELSGVSPEREVVIRGMQDNPHWTAAFKDPAEVVDTDVIEREVVNEAIALQETSSRLGAIVLECSLMPPYARAVHEATGLPVYDFMSVINLFQRATHQKPCHGIY
ncbi:MAG: aspartate/glutamate racemase family protein [Thiotrichales bacterium]|nr:aspartate/glutamate racemase family protein [Thiotrichales bacterium]